MTSPIKNCKWLLYPLGDITQHFGENIKLYQDAMGWTGGHNGVDLVRPWGEHLYAIEDAVVCSVKDTPEGYGKHVRLLALQPDGTYHEWSYGHMSYIHVTLGQKVKEGDFIGCMGNTGFVVSGDTPYWRNNPYAGTHLHITLRLARKTPTGWKYEYKGSPRIEIKNYDNGTKGAIDPIPYFFTAKALGFRSLAEKTRSKTLYQLAELLTKINV